VGQGALRREPPRNPFANPAKPLKQSSPLPGKAQNVTSSEQSHCKQQATTLVEIHLRAAEGGEFTKTDSATTHRQRTADRPQQEFF